MTLQRFLAAFISGLIFLSAVPAYAATTEQPPEEIMARIKRLCQKFSDQDRIRCESREVKRWQDSKSLMRTPTTDYEFRDKQDFGQNHLRSRVQSEIRRNAFQKASTRRTYRQLQPTDDVNTRLNPYLNELKQKRLECHLKPPGRQRSMCMDQVAQWARKQMTETTSSKEYPAR